jgi:hypothetical protein
MEKILKALLAAKVPGVDIDILNEIIQATPNPEIATEMLCGLYEEPVISPIPVKPLSKMYYNPQFLKYDKLKERVYFTYQKSKTKKYWVGKGETPVYGGNIGIEEKEGTYYRSDIAKLLGISEQEVRDRYIQVEVGGEPSDEVSTSDTYLSSWQ